MKKTQKKVGDKVTASIRRASTGGIIEIEGKVKSIRQDKGQTTYIITGGKIKKDFSTRIIK